MTEDWRDRKERRVTEVKRALKASQVIQVKVCRDLMDRKASEVCQVTLQNPKMAWRVPEVPVASLVQLVSLVCSGSRVCLDFVRRGTAAFMRR